MKKELWKYFHNKGIIIAVLVGSIIAVVESVSSMCLPSDCVFGQELILLPNGKYCATANVRGISIFCNWLGVTTMNPGNSLYYFLLPIIASLPIGVTIENEKKSNYYIHLKQRYGYRKVLIRKFLMGMLTGGIVVTLPLVFNFLINMTFLPVASANVISEVAPITSDQVGSWLFYTHSFLFVIADLSIVFLWGCSMAALCIASEYIISKKYISIFVPLVICMIFEFSSLYTAEDIKIEFSPMQLFHLATIRANSIFIIFGEILFFIIISFVISMRKAKNEI